LVAFTISKLARYVDLHIDLLTGGIGIVIGLATYGYKIIKVCSAHK